MGIVQENIDREPQLSHAITIIYQGSVKKNDGISLAKKLFGVNLNIMKTQSIDTHPKAEAVQIQLIRQASVAQRIARMRTLTSSLLQLSKRAIRRANPEASQEELDILFVKYHYGEALAARFQAYLQQRNT